MSKEKTRRSKPLKGIETPGTATAMFAPVLTVDEWIECIHTRNLLVLTWYILYVLLVYLLVYQAPSLWTSKGSNETMTLQTQHYAYQDHLSVRLAGAATKWSESHASQRTVRYGRNLNLVLYPIPVPLSAHATHLQNTRERCTTPKAPFIVLMVAMHILGFQRRACCDIFRIRPIRMCQEKVLLTWGGADSGSEHGGQERKITHCDGGVLGDGAMEWKR